MPRERALDDDISISRTATDVYTTIDTQSDTFQTNRAKRYNKNLPVPPTTSHCSSTQIYPLDNHNYPCQTSRANLSVTVVGSASTRLCPQCCRRDFSRTRYLIAKYYHNYLKSTSKHPFDSPKFITHKAHTCPALICSLRVCAHAQRLPYILQYSCVFVGSGTGIGHVPSM